MRALSKRVKELETIMAPEPLARMYDYRHESDAAWFEYCQGLGLTMYDLLRRMDGKQTKSHDEIVKKTVTKLMQTPKDQRFD